MALAFPNANLDYRNTSPINALHAQLILMSTPSFGEEHKIAIVL